MRKTVTLTCFSLLFTAVFSSGTKAAAFSFSEHWSLPIPFQGSAPEEFSDLERSLSAEDCGACHEKQYEEWKTSRHAGSMGPGVTGQFHLGWLDERTTEICFDCHAPLSEQRKYLLSEGEYKTNDKQDKPLAAEGLNCAGCHVRSHVRYGPIPKAVAEDETLHGGFVEVKNFGAAEFCKPCHQFDPDDRRVGGKLLEDTYQQWKKSGYEEKGVECAECHMLDRSHLWRGIHDPDMTKNGVTFSAVKQEDNTIRVTIKNSGVGHLFPTYVTPQVAVRLVERIDDKLKVFDEKWIGWGVALDLSEEYFDTRIKPGESFSHTFKVPKREGEGTFAVLVVVYPDEFYNRFFRSLVSYPPEGMPMERIKEAVKETGRSFYTLFEKRFFFGP